MRTHRLITPLVAAALLAACSGDTSTTAQTEGGPDTATGSTPSVAPAPAGPLTPPTPVGSAAYNEWLGRTFSDTMLNTRDDTDRAALIRQIVHPGYIQHNPLAPEGRDGLTGFVDFIYDAMPDSRFELLDVIATEDRVVTRWTWTATLTGVPLFGIEPTGQQLEFDAIDIWTVRDGQLYEHWDQFDWPRALHQLGVTGLPQAFVDVANAPADR